MSSSPRTGLVAGAVVLLSLTPNAALAQNCPNPRPLGVELNYEMVDLWQPRSHQVVAGGPLNLGACAEVLGHGYITPIPDFSLFLGPNTRGQALDIRVEAPCDAVLLVSEGWGPVWNYSDDVGGDLNPHIRLSGVADGLHAIWVGTYGPETCNATLILEVN